MRPARSIVVTPGDVGELRLQRRQRPHGPLPFLVGDLAPLILISIPGSRRQLCGPLLDSYFELVADR